MFKKILIANRGEIAARVIRTARRMGVRTVAVFSEADAGALHARNADEALPIGPAPARDSYLSIDRILAAAKASGAEAIHPGYGFLAENADFAERCAQAGIVFIGPPPAAIRAMGLKAQAKAIMEKAGVPLVPGYHGDDQDEERLAREAARIGFPVLIKPSAGGGGKGMRRVDGGDAFAAALAAARREAMSSFGDDRVLIERCFERPRHVEVQIFADRHGHVVHLFERDCSVQRRHQKVIEEAPAPGVSADLRARMTAAAIAAARAIAYEGAGTIEFLLEPDGRFYFMEMNTRLQVEHPVTEMITGLDLVEWQLRVACGEALPLAQDQIVLNGHAIEARIYAEDPARGFLPASGRLVHLRWPSTGDDLRIDAGVEAGDAVSIHYDPLIAKMIAWGRDREGAIARLAEAVGRFQAVGPATNLDFLGAMLAHPVFASGAVDIGTIDRHRDELVHAAPAGQAALAAASLYVLSRRAEDARDAARLSGDPNSPWHRPSGFRLNIEAEDTLRFQEAGREIAVGVRYRGAGYLLSTPEGPIEAHGAIASGEGEASNLVAHIAGREARATIVGHDRSLIVFMDGRRYDLALAGPRMAADRDEAPSGGLVAPMPGKVVQVHVRPGEAVKRGQALMVLEAMKMEHAIAAPGDGIVRSVRFKEGDMVPEGAELLVFEPEAP
jgi:3-methylcrotonyl-CoA carboxylase alpha subunit